MDSWPVWVCLNENQELICINIVCDEGGETWPIDDPNQRSSTSEDPEIAAVLLSLILVPSLLITICSAEALKLKPGRTRARRLKWISENSFFMWLRFMVAILTRFEAALKVHRRDQR
jgi:hypothetical protein